LLKEEWNFNGRFRNATNFHNDYELISRRYFTRTNFCSVYNFQARLQNCRKLKYFKLDEDSNELIEDISFGERFLVIKFTKINMNR
jgi:hypothetical protein